MIHQEEGISYNITPANHSCSSITNVPIQSINPTSPTATTANDLANVENQHNENSRYDNVSDMDIKPMTGGKKTDINKIISMNDLKEYIKQNYLIKSYNKSYRIPFNFDLEGNILNTKYKGYKIINVITISKKYFWKKYLNNIMKFYNIYSPASNNFLDILHTYNYIDIFHIKGFIIRNKKNEKKEIYFLYKIYK